MDYATLKSLKPGEFEGTADGYRTMSNMAKASKDRIDNEIIAKLNKELEGDALTAAVGQLRKLSTNFHYAQTECGLISTSLNALASDLREAKNKLNKAVEDAENEGFTVKPDGSVSYPAGGDKVDGKKPEGGTATGRTGNDSDTFVGDNANDQANALERQASNLDPNPHSGPAQQYANRIARAVKEATEADHKWAPKLRGLMADDDLTVSSKDWADAQKDMTGVQKGAKDYLDDIKDPPKNGTPKENAEWWKGLSNDERDDYVSLHPASIGKMDGLPADVRDGANRVVLAEKKAQYQTELNSIPRMPTPRALETDGGYRNRLMEWNRKYADRKEHLEKSLNGMNRIEQRFTDTGNTTKGNAGLPPAYLLGISPEGNGRAIIANGNPDTADHTAVMVPGMNTTLEGANSPINAGQELWKSSKAAAPSENVSTITWMGYDSPQGFGQASDGYYAHQGAENLNHFLSGIQEAQGGPDSSHTSVMAHSYGSRLAGEAAQSKDFIADDLITAGSPGVDAGHASELHVPRGHVWDETASKDFIPTVGAPAHGSAEPAPQDPGVPPSESGQSIKHVVPSDKEFGANRMATDTEGHGTYWTPNSESLMNQARVVTGKTQNVQLKD